MAAMPLAAPWRAIVVTSTCLSCTTRSLNRSKKAALDISRRCSQEVASSSCFQIDTGACSTGDGSAARVDYSMLEMGSTAGTGAASNSAKV